MKISILIPVYNVEDYLCECLDSVIRQTHQDFEMILVDDGSSDRSGLICDQYALLYPQKVKVIHTTNGGPFRARLLAIQEATGDILLFLDSDDCFCKDALEKIFDCFECEKCDMVMFDSCKSSEFATVQIKHGLAKGSIFEGDSKKEIYHNIVLGLVPNSVCLKAVRRECVRIPDHFYAYNAKHGEDLLLSVHLMTYCKKIVYMDKGLYYYRNRAGSSTHSFNTQRKESIKLVHTELDKYIEQWGLPELKPLHNARKVRGWMDNLILLIKNRKYMPHLEFREQVKSMAKDPYFRSAYISMNKSILPCSKRYMAFFLYHFHFLLF